MPPSSKRRDLHDWVVTGVVIVFLLLGALAGLLLSSILHRLPHAT